MKRCDGIAFVQSVSSALSLCSHFLIHVHLLSPFWDRTFVFCHLGFAVASVHMRGLALIHCQPFCCYAVLFQATVNSVPTGAGTGGWVSIQSGFNLALFDDFSVTEPTF